MFKLLKRDQVLEFLGYSKSTLYAKQADKSFPPPLENTGTQALWPDFEVAQVLKGHILGKNKAQMQYLVERMLQERELGIIKSADQEVA